MLVTHTLPNMVGCSLCGRDTGGSSSCRGMQDRLPVSEDGFTYLHSVLNILSAAECYDGELSVDGQLCDSCADSLEQLEQLQNQVRDLVEFLLAGYQQRCRYSAAATVKEEKKESAAQKRSSKRRSSPPVDVAAPDDGIPDDKSDDVDWTQVGPASSDVSTSDLKEDLKDEDDDDDDSKPPIVECETQLTVRRGRRGRGRGGVSSRRGRGGAARESGEGRAAVVRRKRERYFKPDRILSRCELCGESFLSGLTLLRHVEEKHGEEAAAKMTTCDICHYRLKTQRMLARHKFKGEKKFSPIFR